MTQNSKDQDTFSGEPFPGVRLIETLYVRNPLAQGKRRREDWFAEKSQSTNSAHDSKP